MICVKLSLSEAYSSIVHLAGGTGRELGNRNTQMLGYSLEEYQVQSETISFEWLQ